MLHVQRVPDKSATSTSSALRCTRYYIEARLLRMAETHGPAPIWSLFGVRSNFAFSYALWDGLNFSGKISTWEKTSGYCVMRRDAPTWVTGQRTAVAFLELLDDSQLGAPAPRVCSLLLRPCGQQHNPLRLPGGCPPILLNPVRDILRLRTSPHLPWSHAWSHAWCAPCTSSCKLWRRYDTTAGRSRHR